MGIGNKLILKDLYYLNLKKIDNEKNNLINNNNIHKIAKYNKDLINIKIKKN